MNLKLKKFYKQSPPAMLTRRPPFGVLDLVQWGAPLANVAIAPAVILSTLNHSLWGYALIAVNLLLSAWHARYLGLQIWEDTTYRNHHALQALLITAVTLAACESAWRLLPANLHLATSLLVLGIVASTLFNLSASLSELTLPCVLTTLWPHSEPPTLPQALALSEKPHHARALGKLKDRERFNRVLGYFWQRRCKLQQKLAGAFFHAKAIAQCEKFMSAILSDGDGSDAEKFLRRKLQQRQATLRVLTSLGTNIRRNQVQNHSQYFQMPWWRFSAPTNEERLECLGQATARQQGKIEQLQACLPKPTA